MFEIFDKIFTGIFTEPTTSVVAVLLLFVALLIWFFLKMLTQNKELQEILLAELKETYKVNARLVSEYDALKQTISDNKVKLAENLTTMEKLNNKFDSILGRIPKRATDLNQ